MDMDQAAVFLAGSILTVMGFLIILVGIVIANNIIHKYWKSFGWSWMPTWSTEPQRFASQEELDRIAPQFEEHKK
jgi:uncharacterized membrane protein